MTVRNEDVVPNTVDTQFLQQESFSLLASKENNTLPLRFRQHTSIVCHGFRNLSR